MITTFYKFTSLSFNLQALFWAAVIVLLLLSLAYSWRLTFRNSATFPERNMAESLDSSASSKKKVPPLREDQHSGPYSDPVYKKISRLNGEINKMTKEAIRKKLSDLGMDTRGVKEVLKKRLKNYYKKQKLTKAHVEKPGEIDQIFDYLMVIDFEATCEEHNPHNFKYEIIEFPVVLVDVNKKAVAAEFHSYVQPSLNPKLSSFCTELTGISQATVNAAPTFPDVLEQMERWMDKLGLDESSSVAVVTDGPWDMSRFLHIQTQLSGIPFPSWAKQWINIRKTYSNFYGLKRIKLAVMLDNLGMTFEGHQHSGIDDARNIARIVIHMLEDGSVFKINERLHVEKGPGDMVISGVEVVDQKSPAVSDAEDTKLDSFDGSESKENDCPVKKKGCDKSEAAQNPSASKERSSVRKHRNEQTASLDEGFDDLLAYYALQKL